jgi:DNA-binding transcriptional MerR regulator
MFKIGDFSRIARVSCRLLRYYDELGLLKPTIVDRSSGYRFYSAAQLQQLNRILVLRDLGLSLDQIARATSKAVSADELRAMLLIRRADVEQALAAESERLRQIEMRIAQIDSVQSFAEARGAIQELVRSVPKQLPRGALGALMAIAHSSEFEPDSIDIEYGFTLAEAADQGALAQAAEAGGMQLHELPPVSRMAVCVRIGLPEHAHLITAKIGQFVESNGYALAGPSREVFLQTPQLERMENSVVEMQYPVEPMR